MSVNVVPTITTQPATQRHRGALPLLRALLDEPADLESHLRYAPPTEDETLWLHQQGLAPFVFYRLRESELLAALPSTARTRLEQCYHASAMREALRHQVGLQVLAALKEAGVESLAMKGWALAHTVYPSPRCRPMSDLDLWVPVEQWDRAIEALVALDYEPRGKEERPDPLKRLYGGEQQLLSPGPQRISLELQQPAIRGEWLRHVAAIEHEAIWQRRQPLIIEGASTTTMAHEDLLLHVAVHQGVAHKFRFPCWLRSNLDIHFLVTQGLDWEAVLANARQWRLESVTWMVLDLTARLLGTPVPNKVLAKLAPSPQRRTALRAMEPERSLVEMWPNKHDHRTRILQFLLVDRPTDTLSLAWNSLFPEQAWLEARYGADSRAALWRARLLHPLKLLTSARV